MTELKSRYLFIASMDIDPDREGLFNDVYNTEHCPLLNETPGVIGVTRYETQRLVMAMGGEVREIEIPGTPKHHAVYQIESPDVLTSRSGRMPWTPGAGLNRCAPTRKTAATS